MSRLYWEKCGRTGDDIAYHKDIAKNNGELVVQGRIHEYSDTEYKAKVKLADGSVAERVEEHNFNLMGWVDTQWGRGR